MTVQLPRSDAHDLASTAATFRQALALIETYNHDPYYTPLAAAALQDLIQKIETRRRWAVDRRR